MDRGVFIGGGLICASFLLAVLLNESAREAPRMPEPAKTTRADPAAAECHPTTDRALNSEAPPEAASQSRSARPPDRVACK